MDIENCVSSESIPKSHQSCNIYTSGQNYQDEAEAQQNEQIDVTCENSPSSESITKSPQLSSAISNYQEDNDVIPPYNTRSSINTSKRQFYGRVTPRYTAQNSTARKQARRKRSNAEYGDHKVSVQKVKYYFGKLSPPDQRKFMKEMATEENLKGGVLDKGLKIHNIEHCVIQVDPINGEYITHASNL